MTSERRPLTSLKMPRKIPSAVTMMSETTRALTLHLVRRISLAFAQTPGALEE